VDSADKAARFIWLCDAFNIPLVFLADVPGFMIGREVERQGIIRHGAKMITAVSEATVPKFCVVVRKAYGAGLYAMAGPGFEPDATLALPTASIAVMGPEAAVNAVYYNKLAALGEAERPAEVERLQRETREDVGLVRLAARLVGGAGGRSPRGCCEPAGSWGWRGSRSTPTPTPGRCGSARPTGRWPSGGRRWPSPTSTRASCWRPPPRPGPRPSIPATGCSASTPASPGRWPRPARSGGGRRPGPSPRGATSWPPG